MAARLPLRLAGPRLPLGLGRATRTLRASARTAPESLFGSPASTSARLRSSSARGASAVVAAAPGMYQSPRRLCSALLQRDASGLRRLPTPGLRRQSPPPAAAPRPASPRLLAAASAASGAARSCSRAGECTVPGGERRGYPSAAATWRRRRMNGKRRAAGVGGPAGKRVLLSSFFRFPLALPILGLASRPVGTGTPVRIPFDPWMRCLRHFEFLT